MGWEGAGVRAFPSPSPPVTRQRRRRDTETAAASEDLDEDTGHTPRQRDFPSLLVTPVKRRDATGTVAVLEPALKAPPATPSPPRTRSRTRLDAASTMLAIEAPPAGVT